MRYFLKFVTGIEVIFHLFLLGYVTPFNGGGSSVSNSDLLLRPKTVCLYHHFSFSYTSINQC